MFQGAALLSLDAKGRMAVPAKHRDALLAAGEGRLVLTAHHHGCLLLYPHPTWVPIRAQLIALSSMSQQAALLRRLIVGHADEVELDASGRLLVPPSLRDHGALEKDVWLVGQGANFEIWSDARWRAQQLQMAALGDSPLPPGLENLAL